MGESLLKNKQFFCREWVFGKIHHCLESRQSAKTCGVLLMGGPGCGKTAICTELIWPTVKQGKQNNLRERLLAYHFCHAHDIETLSVKAFVLRLIEQLSESDKLPEYKVKLGENCLCQSLLTSCECKPDELFTECVVHILNEIKSPNNSLFLLIDSIDESLYETYDNPDGTSKTIADLISKYHHMFPPWLILICSSRKQSKSVTRLFAGFRKISLDDLRKSHVVRDVQQYILCRLDSERELRQHLSKETAEMLNQLHIKSNGCFLYLERVLDGVGENFVVLREIREIPGTLNGLYLWLCQRLFIRKQFYKIQPILNVILATRHPLCANVIYKCVKTHSHQLTRDDFDRRLKLLSKILIIGPNDTKLLFHHSFAEWLLDVKHCTQKYLCNAAEGHGMLAMNYTLNAHSLLPADVQEFALHLVRCNSRSILEQYHLVHWLLLSGADITSSLSTGLPNDPKVLNLLNISGATMPIFTSLSETLQISAAKHQQYSVEKTVDAVKLLERSTASINEVEMCDKRQDVPDLQLDPTASQLPCNVNLVDDANNVMGLHIASQQGNTLMVDSILANGVKINDPDEEGWTALRTAAWGGHTDVVDLLIKSGAIVDCTGKDNRTALRAAAWGGHEDILKKLIAHGADVNKVDNEGRTALIAAAYMGHRDIVAYLIECGADINHQDCDGRTALSVAALCIPASEGHSDVVGLLLEHGAEVDHRDKEGVTPLLVAAYEGHHDVCELLLEFDAEVDHSDCNNRTPLLAAASMGHARVVNQLLFWGAAVDTIDGEGRTVLSIAAAHGSMSVVQTLLDRGLDEMHRDNAGSTPLHMAAYEGHAQVCSILVQHGAKVNDIDNDGRHALILAAQEGHLNAVKTLLHLNSDLDHRAHDGKTAFRSACLEGHDDVAYVLICEGTNINYQDADGRSTLYICALENKVRVAGFLLENGAEAEGFDLEGRTPLHVASWQGHYQMVALLLKYQAYVDSMDNDQRTPLQSASWQGHEKVVRLLLECGAKVDHSCNQGATALCIAAQEGHEDVVRVLLEYKANPSHSDQFGRTAMKVASKSGHSNVIKLLEQFGVSPASSTHSRKSEHSSSSAENRAMSTYVNVNVVNGLGIHSTPSNSPESTYDRRKSYFSNHSSSKSSMLTSTNSSSVGQSLHNSDSLTFTQQLQQCSMPRNRSRPISRLLTPVSEPHSPTQSPVISPPDTPAVEISKLTTDEHVNFLSPSPVKYTGSKKEKIAATINIYTNPNEDLINGEDDPVWKLNPQFMHTNNLSKSDLYHRKNGNSSDRSPQLIMGQSMLQNTSPELKKKRNGIVTNPNCKKSPPPSVVPCLSESMVISNATVTNNHKNNAMNQAKSPRPNGLQLKKETPL